VRTWRTVNRAIPAITIRVATCFGFKGSTRRL
jgi:hypothetical protein